jgi:hypothetical protein
MGRLSFLLCCLYGLAFIPPAFGQDAPDEQAKVLYQNGQQLYEEGLYEEAILAFEEAWTLSKRPALLYNIANAQERLGKLQDAVDTLNKYRVYAALDERETIERRLRALERRLSEERAVVVPPPAPTPTPVVVAPVPLPEPVPAPSSRRGPGAPLIGTGVGAALVGGVVAGVTYGMSRSDVTQGDQAGYERLRPWNNVGLGLAAAGAVVALTGGVLLSGEPRLVPVGNGLVFTGRF